MPRELRGALGGTFYWDLVAAHPNLILDLVKRPETFPALAGYVNDRDTRVNSVREAHGVDRECAENLFNAMIYFCDERGRKNGVQSDDAERPRVSGGCRRS